MLREKERIVRDMREVRKGKASIDTWALEEVTEDIEVIVKELHDDIIKLHKSNFQNKKARQRVRVYTKTLETLGIKFRTLSVLDD